MRIGFTGSQCSGKSTQAKFLEDRDGFIAVPSASNIAAKNGVIVNREGDLSTQFVIIGKIEEQKYLYHQEDLVWERTHIDALAYSQTCNLWGLDEAYLTIHRALAINQMKHYFDIVFYFPAYPLDNFLGELNNGVRDIDPEYRNRIDTIIKTELDLAYIDYYSVPEGNVKYVHDFIKKTIHGEKSRRTS